MRACRLRRANRKDAGTATWTGRFALPLIDQRILIDAPPEVVWQLISDQSQLPSWHAGYTSVSVLTTQQRGSGVRRRCTLAGGKDVIEEISAWVDGMGYEYHRVEGGPYKDYQGRLRLQLGPDGTSVQWTITYTPKGLLGQLRDRLKGNREHVQMVSASLRQLRREVDALGQRMNDQARARAAIRARLSADERAAFAQRQGVAEDEGQAPPHAAAPSRTPRAAEPSFVSELAVAEPVVDPLADTQPQDAPEEAAAPPDSPGPIDTPPPATPEEEVPLHQRVTPAHGTPSVQPSSSVIEGPAPHPPASPVPPPAEIKPPAASEAPALPPPAEIKPPAPVAQPEADPYARFRRPADATRDLNATPPGGVRPAALQQEAAASPEPRPGLPPQTPKTDTGEISIWEVFGLRRPSDQDADALDDLIQSLQARQMAEQRLQGRFVRRSARVRFPAGTLGLRLQLALRAAGVRLARQRHAAARPEP